MRTDWFPDLDTPAAVVDLDRVHANLDRVAGYCREHGLAWRPHIKTHKTPELAVAQMTAGACGLTVATLREAEVMAAVAKDLLLAYPTVGAAKRRRLTRLLQTGVRLSVGLDSVDALEAVSAAARAAGVTVSALVELDLGMKRTGAADPQSAVALARQVAADSVVEYGGVMFYPGHLTGVVGETDPKVTQLSSRLNEFLAALRDVGLPAGTVSGGSTPTFWQSHRVEGLTEIRPGTNVFYDRYSVEAKVGQWDDCAYTILATVVSTAVPGQAVIDAGSKALAREAMPGNRGGFGALLERPELVVSRLSEEHGVIDLTGSDWRPHVGDRVRVVPNHVCVSVNLQERLWVVHGDEPVEEWLVAARGR